MALPWLESLCLGDAARRTAFPKRFAVLFMGNGVNEDHWDAQGLGAAMKLSKTLEPLEPLKHKINVIHGLFHKRADGARAFTRRRPAACSRVRVIQKARSSGPGSPSTR